VACGRGAGYCGRPATGHGAARGYTFTKVWGPVVQFLRRNQYDRLLQATGYEGGRWERGHFITTVVNNVKWTVIHKHIQTDGG